MKTNIGGTDKTVRIVLAVALIVLFFAKVITGALAVVMLIVAGVLLLTVLANFCPIWHFLRISTKEKNHQQENQ